MLGRLHVARAWTKETRSIGWAPGCCPRLGWRWLCPWSSSPQIEEHPRTGGRRRSRSRSRDRALSGGTLGLTTTTASPAVAPPVLSATASAPS
ncbi:hypothetical protein GUJ93_ZPchr0011g28167 [Zizania palustris]|uniref:Uncharacterized protein n=1 Tax=Zizania palustris TaxID=103762 RepID=A0A8J5WMJ1_ZIZPA|nr:hypothetical protein GUJ93_ZPchr0011g28167 [Zizania palustris]